MADQAIYSPQRVLDANGDPVPGAIVTFYAAGSLTMIDVWVDADGTILGTNPVIADADGYLPQRFVTEQAKVVITDADGATIRTVDPVPTVPGSFGSAAVVGFSPTVNLPFSNVQAAIEGVDAGARSREAALGKLLRVDAAQSLSGGEQTQGRSNLGLGTLATVSPTGTPDGSKFLRDDNSWQVTPGPSFDGPVSTASGSAAQFTGIAAGANKITITFDKVSLSGTGNLLVQLGTSGGYVTSGYESSGSSNGSGTQFTTGFGIRIANAAQDFAGQMTLTRIPGTNRWIESYNGFTTAATSYFSGGGVLDLGGTLDRLQIVPSADSFDAGQISIEVA